MAKKRKAAKKKAAPTKKATAAKKKRGNYRDETMEFFRRARSARFFPS